MFCNKCGAKISERNIFCTECGNMLGSKKTVPPEPQLQSPVFSLPNKPSFDFTAFFVKYKWWLTGITTLLITAVTAYKIFLEPKPDKDARKILQQQCNCYTQYDEANTRALQQFNNGFAAAAYQSRNKARNSLFLLQQTASTGLSNCLSNIESNQIKLRTPYLNNPKKLAVFDNLIENGWTGGCKRTGELTMNALQTEADALIEKITDPEPDAEKIKNDLLGREVPGWNFSYLAEFTSFEIINNTRGTGRLEYEVKMSLHDNSNNNEHLCVCYMVYTTTGENWYLSSISEQYITYDYTIQPGSFTTIYPLSNCAWSASNDAGLVWRTGEYYSNDYYTGPGYPHVTLPFSDKYLIKTTETYPVTLRFTYRPK